MTQEQENIIKNLKKQLERECAKKTYHFDGPSNKPLTFKTGNDYTVSVSEPRCPNENEIRDWMKNRLREYYFSHSDTMSTQQYRVEKGKIWRNQYEQFFNFMRNRGVDITEDLEKFKKCKYFVSANVILTFAQPVASEILAFYGGGMNDD